MDHSDVSFDLSTVFGTVAQAVPDHTFLVWRRWPPKVCRPATPDRLRGDRDR